MSGGTAPAAIAVTGHTEGVERVASLIEEAGIRAVRWPTIDFAPPAEIEPLRAAVEAIDTYDWVTFTSPRAVEAVTSLRAVPPERCAVAAVGEETANALSERGWRAHLVGDGQGAESLADALVSRVRAAGSGASRGEPGPSAVRVFFPASSLASKGLEEILSRNGVRVDRVTAYRTIDRTTPPERIRADLAWGVRGVTFSSPSSVRVAAAWIDEVTRLFAACIGPTTAAAAHAAGFAVVEVAAEANAESLAEAALRALSGR